MKRIRDLAVLLAMVVSVPAFAGVVDDAIALAGRGLSEDVILAWADGQGGEAIGVNEILRMKDGKVPDRVIARIIRQQNRAAAPQVNVADREAPVVQRETVRYVERPSVSYVTPAVYAAPVAYRTPLYYSDSYYGYPYTSSYYPYRSYPSVGLSLSFGNGYYGSSRYSGCGYYGSYGHRYSSGYSGRYSGGHYSSGHYGSGSYSGGYSGGHSGSGYHGGGTGYSSYRR